MSARLDRLMILLPPDLLEAIDGYRRTCSDLPPRTEAIRRLLRLGLIDAGHLPPAGWVTPAQAASTSA